MPTGWQCGNLALTFFLEGPFDATRSSLALHPHRYAGGRLRDILPFKWSINPYRGCYHQCVFCYARRTHWFLDEDGVDRWAPGFS